MRWLTADIVFDGYDFKSNYYLQVDTDGTILQIQNEKPRAQVNHYQGLLMPGTVNAHCHLELSHSKGLIKERTGLSTFLQNVSEIIPHKSDEGILLKAMLDADKEMYRNGVVAVGDICNTTISISVKKESRTYYHSYIECIAIKEIETKRRFKEYQEVQKKFKNAELSTSLGLHTPYTCNEEVYRLVNDNSSNISIHNQESEAENLLFQRKAGDFDNFYAHFGLEKSEILKTETSTSSFVNTNRLLSRDKKKLFVHNTFLKPSDFAHFDSASFWCFCPNANLYIENRLPNIPIFLDYQDRIVLGTDSLASNNSLNILSEVKVIQDHFPDIPTERILQWATINGATFLDLESEFGSMEVGKKPGILSVADFDITNCKLLSSAVHRIL